MANREVNLTKRVQTPQGMRYCRVAVSANGRIKPDAVYVNGREERHPEGAYYVEWYEGAKRVRLSVGKSAADASSRRQRKEAELSAINNGLTVSSGEDGHRSLAATVGEFLEETRLSKKPKTVAAYTTALQYFTESCPKLFLEDIERRDLLKFAAFLREEKNQSPRSVYNKFACVISFLKAHDIRGLVAKNDWPRFVEQEPEVYEREELDKLFAVCDAEEPRSGRAGSLAELHKDVAIRLQEGSTRGGQEPAFAAGRSPSRTDPSRMPGDLCRDRAALQSWGWSPGCPEAHGPAL